MECDFDGCSKPARSKGLCSAHYERQRKYGSPDIVMPPVPPPIRRLHETCTVDGCDRTHLARGYCDHHYRRFKLYGDPLITVRRRNVCTIDGCGRAAHSQGWCRLHWERWRRHGDPSWVAEVFTTCVVAGCDKASRSGRSPFCEMHYYRIRRNGHLDALDMRAEVVGYRAAHSRIEKDRGQARRHRCVDCGQRADHWSYDHGDADHLIGPAPHFLPYSLDVHHYQPRCRACHRRFDRAHGQATQPGTDGVGG